MEEQVRAFQGVVDLRLQDEGGLSTVSLFKCCLGPTCLDGLELFEQRSRLDGLPPQKRMVFQSRLRIDINSESVRWLRSFMVLLLEPL